MDRAFRPDEGKKTVSHFPEVPSLDKCKRNCRHILFLLLSIFFALCMAEDPPLCSSSFFFRGEDALKQRNMPT